MNDRRLGELACHATDPPREGCGGCVKDCADCCWGAECQQRNSCEPGEKPHHHQRGDGKSHHNVGQHCDGGKYARHQHNDRLGGHICDDGHGEGSQHHRLGNIRVTVPPTTGHPLPSTNQLPAKQRGARDDGNRGNHG